MPCCWHASALRAALATMEQLDPLRNSKPRHIVPLGHPLHTQDPAHAKSDANIRARLAIQSRQALVIRPETCVRPGAGIPELVARLQGLRKQVFLVSGGFRPLINPIAAMLGIPLAHVYANTILYKVAPLWVQHGLGN